jgi:condensin complex subunit 1
LCHAVKSLSSILNDEQEKEGGLPSSHVVVSQQFRDALAFHLYMLFSAMFIIESEAKVGSSLKTGRTKSDSQEGEDVVHMRAICADAMLVAAQSMAGNRQKLWKRGVADESVVVLPCRIAYQMLEGATGVLARKAFSADAAMGIIAATVDAYDFLLGTVLAALMDMLHSFEHMASICAELCCMVSESPSNRLAVELIREMGRLDTTAATGTEGGKASGIKFVAPFIQELAQRRPRIVLSNIAHLLPHLDSEPYTLRSSIVTAIGHIVEHMGKVGQESEDGENDPRESDSQTFEYSSINIEKSRALLVDILLARARDTSSYTRSAVLKAWISLSQTGAIPIVQIHAVTDMAIDRLHDKTVMVRKQALQVRNGFALTVDP